VGADECPTKPFSMRELFARIKALLRRDRLVREELQDSGGEERPAKQSFGNLTIDEARLQVFRQARDDARSQVLAHLEAFGSESTEGESG
jgi:DNA-binding response OmpR family regulator